MALCAVLLILKHSQVFLVYTEKNYEFCKNAKCKHKHFLSVWWKRSKSVLVFIYVCFQVLYQKLSKLGVLSVWIKHWK